MKIHLNHKKLVNYRWMIYMNEWYDYQKITDLLWFIYNFIWGGWHRSRFGILRKEYLFRDADHSYRWNRMECTCNPVCSVLLLVFLLKERVICILQQLITNKNSLLVVIIVHLRYKISARIVSPMRYDIIFANFTLWIFVQFH